MGVSPCPIPIRAVQGVGMSGERPIRFGCPVCGAKITVPYEQRRDEVKCSECHNGVQAAGFQLFWPEMREGVRQRRQKRLAAKVQKAKEQRERQKAKKRKAREAKAVLQAQSTSAPAKPQTPPNSTRLVACPDCGHEVSRKAFHCPNCGRELHASETERVSSLIMACLWIVVILVIGVGVILAITAGCFSLVFG